MVNVFFQSSRSRGQKLQYRVKGLVTRNTHVQYESSISSGEEVMAKVKVFQKQVKLQGQGHKVKIMVPCEMSCHKEYTCAI